MEPFTPALSRVKVKPIGILHCLALKVAFYICLVFAEPDCNLSSAGGVLALQRGGLIPHLRFGAGGMGVVLLWEDEKKISSLCLSECKAGSCCCSPAEMER